MRTNERLTAAYKNAKIEYFDMNSKYIIFSDTHRGDDSASDEFTRNQIVFLNALEYYYENEYRYVEAGDGDDLWEYPDFKTIRLAHSDVFKSIKKFFDAGRLVLIYGNHNIYLRSKSYCKKKYYTYYDEFSQETHEFLRGLKPYEALVLKSKNTGLEILIVHGHQGDFMNDQFWMVSMVMLRYFWRFMHVVGFQNPASPAKNLYKSCRIEIKYKKWIAKNHKIIICGHTHRPKFPRKNDLPYFNAGCGVHTKGITGIEIADGQIMLVSWRIQADSDGILRIKRNIVRGPQPIENFAFK